MKCEEIRQLLSAYGCEDMQVDERRKIEEHLAECSGCREQLDALRTFQDGIRGHLCEPVEYPDVTRSVMSLLREKRKPARLVYAWAGGICVVATILIGLCLHRSDALTGPTASNPPTMTTARAKRAADIPEVVPAEKPVVVQQAVSPRKVRRLPTDTRARTDAIVKEKEPIAHEPAESSAVRLVDVNVTEIPADSDSEVERSRVTTTMVVAGVTLSHTEERIVLPVEPNEQAASIERPPLETVVVSGPYESPGGV
jgi:anti-sigma factor RsiW